MSLWEYDIVNKKLDRTTSWVDPKYFKIFTKECIRDRKGYMVAKKYNQINKDYDFFIIASDVISANPNQPLIPWFKDDYGRVKFAINSIWKELGLSNIKCPVNIDFKCIESTNDYEIYQINT